MEAAKLDSVEEDLQQLEWRSKSSNFIVEVSKDCMYIDYTYCILFIINSLVFATEVRSVKRHVLGSI